MMDILYFNESKMKNNLIKYVSCVTQFRPVKIVY
jgi:hypothetical protein